MDQVLVALNPLEIGFMVAAVHEWRKAHDDPDFMPSLTDKLEEHYPWKGSHTATAAAEVVRLRKIVEALRGCLLPVAVFMAEREAMGEPISDDSFIAGFTAPGLFVTAGQIRRALRGEVE